MARPLVLVFQEYASLNFTPAAVDLNVCVAAPSYDILEYATDKEAIAVATGKVYRVDTEAGLHPFASGTSALLVPLASSTAELTEVPAVYVDSPKVIVAKQAIAAEPSYGNKFIGSAGGFAGVAVGDTVYLCKGSSAPIQERVLTVDDAGAYIFVENSTYTGTGWTVYVIRQLSGKYQVTPSKVTISLSGKTVALQAAPTAIVPVTVDKVTTTYAWELAAAASVYPESVSLRKDRNTVQTITDAAEIPSKLGKLDARNPLAVAAYVAQANAGTTILAYGVTSDTVEGFAEFEREVARRGDIYCAVPVSMDASIRASVIGAMKARLENLASADYALENGVPQKFRMVVGGGLSPVLTTTTVTTATGATSTTSNGGVSYLVTSSSALFATAGVRAGDTATFGSVQYSVVSVSNNQYMTIKPKVAGTGAAVSSGTTITVTRTLTADDKVTSLNAIPAGYASKRVVLPLATYVEIAGVAGTTQLSGAYLACAIGGMIAGLPPHQGITNLSIAGITRVYGTSDAFDDAQLTKLSDAGWCVFSQATPEAAPFCIHGLTSDTTASEFAEIMFVKNFDYVSESLARQLDRFLGTWNINDETIGFVKLALNQQLDRLKARKLPRIGAPVIDGSVALAVVNSSDSNRVETRVNLTLPRSLNTIGLHLVSQ